MGSRFSCEKPFQREKTILKVLCKVVLFHSSQRGGSCPTKNYFNICDLRRMINIYFIIFQWDAISTVREKYFEKEQFLSKNLEHNLGNYRLG